MLLKFAYDGTKFYGYQIQLDVPTVEGEIKKALEFAGIYEFRSASRTDRGVSALGNVISVDYMDPEKLVGIMNSRLRYVFVHSYSCNDINPRHAKFRWYRYHLPDFDYSVEDIRAAAKIFEGTHDFSNFTKYKGDAVLRIDKIEVKKAQGVVLIDFYAQRYLWNMIRRVVGAIIEYVNGNTFDEDVFKKSYKFHMAPPEPLILMDVNYDHVKFKRVFFRKKQYDKFFRIFSGSFVYYYLYLYGNDIDYFFDC